jgi:hypothetical protein
MPHPFAPHRLHRALGALCLTALCSLAATPALAVVSATNPDDWVLAPGAMGGQFDGVAQVLYNNGSGAWSCSGSLLAGGAYVATAAHCADNFSSMTVSFREGEVTRTVVAATVQPQWTGINGTGTDIALLKLDQAVTGIAGFHISTQNDLYKDYLLAGYGYTGTGSIGGNLSNFPAQLHYGYNTWDTTDDALNTSVFGNDFGTSYGVTYVSDFDDGSAQPNTLWQETFYGSLDGSSAGLGAAEGFMTGGDSGGGNFVWNGSEWLLAGVHNTGWVICGCFDANPNWYGSFGELNTATAVFSHASWIEAEVGSQVLAVPEPQTMALWLAGLLGLAWVRPGRRRQADGNAAPLVRN